MSRPYPFPVRVACAIFDAAARVLPGGTRWPFPAEIRENFLDEAADSYREGGAWRLVRSSGAAIVDLAVSAEPAPPRKGSLMPALLQDLRYAVRLFLRQPGFSAGALLMLALGIGGNTAIFTLVNAALIRPLPYHEADRLVRVWGARSDLGESRNPLNPNDAVDWRRGSPLVESLGVATTTTQPLTGAGDPVMIPVALVSSGFFETLQVPAAAGRLFTPEHDRPGRETEVVISDGFWRRALGADPAAVGRTIRISDVTCTIIGILPREFVSPGIAARAVLALVLAVAGVYAIVAFQVARRKREMGIRLALGASPSEVRRLVVRRGLSTVAIGIAIGLLVSFPVMRMLQDTLFGVTPGEPLPYVVAPRCCS